MKWFKPIHDYLQNTWMLARQRGMKAALRANHAKMQSKPQRAPETLTAEAWLSYYQLRREFLSLTPDPKDSARFPKVSILIITYNNLIINQLCLRSIYCNTSYPNFEVIVVDNASTDETPVWLKYCAQNHPNLRIILNTENKGFAAGNNQAAREAAGEYLIFLNNDTVVTNGWMERLLAHLQNDPQIGLIGPVTNATGNEARIQVNYKSPFEFEVFSAERANTMIMRSFDIRMLAFYCVMIRKDLYDLLGGLDERFSVGMFEDDDIAVRCHQHGLRVVCAEDVFIHHFQGASFRKLEHAEYMQIFEENRMKYEEKWGRKWIPYQSRY